MMISAVRVSALGNLAGTKASYDVGLRVEMTLPHSEAINWLGSTASTYNFLRSKL